MGVMVALEAAYQKRLIDKHAEDLREGKERKAEMPDNIAAIRGG